MERLSPSKSSEKELTIAALPRVGAKVSMKAVMRNAVNFVTSVPRYLHCLRNYILAILRKTPHRICAELSRRITTEFSECKVGFAEHKQFLPHEGLRPLLRAAAARGVPAIPPDSSLPFPKSCKSLHFLRTVKDAAGTIGPRAPDSFGPARFQWAAAPERPIVLGGCDRWEEQQEDG